MIKKNPPKYFQDSEVRQFHADDGGRSLKLTVSCEAVNTTSSLTQCR